MEHEEGSRAVLSGSLWEVKHMPALAEQLVLAKAKGNGNCSISAVTKQRIAGGWNGSTTTRRKLQADMKLLERLIHLTHIRFHTGRHKEMERAEQEHETKMTEELMKKHTSSIIIQTNIPIHLHARARWVNKQHDIVAHDFPEGTTAGNRESIIDGQENTICRENRERLVGVIEQSLKVNRRRYCDWLFML